ncbi:MAG: D-glycerate dehydrogenase [Patescibacteria group bacterium]|jgi:glyoxylate reductase
MNQLKKPVVFITRPIPQPGIDLIKRYATVILRKTNSAISRKELLAGAKKADILLPILTDKIDEAFLQANPQLKLIANYGAGFNNIDIGACTAQRVPVTNTPGVLTTATAELTFTLILAVARRIVETDAIMRTGKYPGWGPMLYMGYDINGKTLGIVGMGRIGKRVAEIAKYGFNMNIIYYNDRAVTEVDKSLQAKSVTLKQLFKQADFVSLHVPLTPQTHHLIGKKELAIMKPTACLVNTSRGPVIDEQALVSALKNKTIAGAGLDVYEKEPLMAAGLKTLQNTVLLPHIGSATYTTRTAMAMLAAKNIVAFIQGKPLISPVNKI